MTAITPPLAGVEVNERGQRALDRLKELYALAEVPAGLQALAAAENGMQDIYMNLNRQLADGKLEKKTKLLVALGIAVSKGSAQAASFFATAARNAGRTPAEVADAISVATTCTIFNGYYKFRHQIPEELKAAYEAFRAPFNANSLVKSLLPKTEVEAINIAVSSFNGCSFCVAGHIAKGKEEGLTDEQIDELIRVGAVATGTAAAIEALQP